MDKILVYIGLNGGFGLEKEISVNNTYTKIIGFEPIPHLCENLKKKYENDNRFEIYPYCVGNEDTEVNFFITMQGGQVTTTYSSSMYEITDDYRKKMRADIKTNQIIRVKVISLKKFLLEKNVNFIEKYISDAEGNDFTILSSMVDFINNRKIKKIEIESECDYVQFEQREGQPSNKESDIIKLLENNYNLTGKSHGDYDVNSTSRWTNRDLFFELKGL